MTPSRLWYLAAALLPAGLLGIALTTPALVRGGDPGDQPVPLGRPVPVEMRPPAGRMVWSRQGGAPPADVSCEFTDSRRVSSTSTERILGDPVEIEVDGVRWRAVLLLSVWESGSFQLTCVPVGAGATPTLSIGTPPRFVSGRDRALIMLATAGLTLAGLIAGAVLAGLVAVRRRSAARSRPDDLLSGPGPAE